MYRQVIRGLSSLMLLMTLAACAQGFGGKPAKPEIAATTLTGVGHLGGSVGVSQYYVDGHWGGSANGWGGGGGGVCCIQLPAQKPSTPYMVTVKWETCDTHHITFVDGKSVDPNPRCIKTQHAAIVPVHYADEKLGYLNVHFLPGNKIEIWSVNRLAPNAPDYPGPAYSRGPAPDYAPVIDVPSVTPRGGK